MPKVTIEKFRASGDIADQMITPREKKLLDKFREEIENIRGEFGEPQNNEEDDFETRLALGRVPGSEEVLRKWSKIVESFRLAGTG